MDADQISDWLNDLEERFPLTDLERTAVKVVARNADIVERIAADFVHVDELALWLNRERRAMSQRVDEVVRLNLEWQEVYRTEWEPKLKLVDHLASTEMLEKLMIAARSLATQPTGSYVVTPNGRYFHRPSCKWVVDLPSAILAPVDHEEAVARNFKPCATCRA